MQLRQQLEQVQQQHQATLTELVVAQASLLQQTAIAEACQAQLAAVSLTAKANSAISWAPEEAFGPLAPWAAPGKHSSGSSYQSAGYTNSAGCPPSTQQAIQQLLNKLLGLSLNEGGSCAALGSVIHQGLAADEARTWCGSPGDPASQLWEDPKVQRIQELRAALAAALAQATGSGCNDQLDSSRQGLTAAAANGAAHVGLHGRGSTELWEERSIGAAAEGARLSRIQELTQQLVSASKAVDLGGQAAAAAGAGHLLSSSSAGLEDTKVQRIHELRAALVDAMKERDELRQQLSDGGLLLQEELATTKRELQETRRESEAYKVRWSLMCYSLVDLLLHCCCSTLEP